MAKIKIPVGLIATKEDFDNLNAQKADKTQISALQEQLNTKVNKTDALNLIYPVGSIYISVIDKNPSDFFTGEWERFGTGRTLVGVNHSDSDFETPNKTGGSKTHKLTVSEMPSHKHLIRVKDEAAEGTAIGSPRPYGEAGGATNRQTETVGGNQPHNNMPPYITVYMWRRIS